ncbi:MFS transporter [Salinispira pacifica]
MEPQEKSAGSTAHDERLPPVKVTRVSLAAQLLRTPLSVMRSFEGNARACLIVEPLWGIPYNLYAPYVSLYMLALGCSDMQIGLISTVGLLLQMCFALVSGYITDRMGRRRTSVIFDLIGWSIPSLIWAGAWGFDAFLIAAPINAVFRIVHTSWNCLLIEDTAAERRVHVYTYIYIANILAGFIAPAAGLAVRSWGLVPAMRVFYLFGFVSMTAMFLIRNRFTRETRIGVIRIEQMRGVSAVAVLADYRRLLRVIFSSPRVLVAFFLLLASNIHLVLRTSFLAILLNRALGFPESAIGIFPAVQSAVMLAVFLFVMPRLAGRGPARSLAGGNLLIIAGYLVLTAVQGPSWSLALLGTVLTALGTAVVSPTVDTMVANSIRDEDRAGLTSLLYVFLFGLSAPFGYIGGVLTAVTPRLTFLLVAGTAALSVLLSFIAGKHHPAGTAA